MVRWKVGLGRMYASRFSLGGALRDLQVVGRNYVGYLVSSGSVLLLSTTTRKEMGKIYLTHVGIFHFNRHKSPLIGLRFKRGAQRCSFRALHQPTHGIISRV